MAVINVPKTPKRAFNPDREPSGLIQAQIEHLETAVGLRRGPSARRARRRTEGEAADYIAQLTATLHPMPGDATAPLDPAPSPDTPSPSKSPRPARRHATRTPSRSSSRKTAATPRAARSQGKTTSATRTTGRTKTASGKRGGKG